MVGNAGELTFLLPKRPYFNLIKRAIESIHGFLSRAFGVSHFCDNGLSRNFMSVFAPLARLVWHEGGISYP